MRTKERQYQWYFEPLDSYTNEVFARIFSGDQTTIEENVRCSDGERHDLWSPQSRYIGVVRRSQEYSALQYKLWVQELPGGAIRPAPRFLSRQKRVAKKAARKLTS